MRQIEAFSMTSQHKRLRTIFTQKKKLMRKFAEKIDTKNHFLSA